MYVYGSPPALGAETTLKDGMGFSDKPGWDLHTVSPFFYIWDLSWHWDRKPLKYERFGIQKEISMKCGFLAYFIFCITFFSVFS